MRRKMDTSGVISVRIEDVLILLKDHVFYDMRNKSYVGFSNDRVTFIPESLMPIEILVGIKTQINQTLKKKNTYG